MAGVLSQWEMDWAARPKMRGWLHAVAAPAALVSTTILAVKRRKHRKSVVAYGAGLTSMLAASSVYHRVTRSEKWEHWTRPTDHAMIFGAIAGTSTPIAAVVLPRKMFPPAMAALWGCAALGAFGRVQDLRHAKQGLSASAVAYMVLGWAGAALLPSVIKQTGVKNGALIAAGGGFYTLGAILFALEKPNPFPSVYGYHEVWHTLTIAGALVHLAAIASITE